MAQNRQKRIALQANSQRTSIEAVQDTLEYISMKDKDGK
jgi:hypothetical protein